ncbi:MAG: hypothetical protein IT307_00545 [Chloroflexi bacterium]|nr:hypothetical protein [Chloroflexota bacterium]
MRVPPWLSLDVPELHPGAGPPEAQAGDTGQSQLPERPSIVEVDPVLAGRTAADCNRLSPDGGVQPNGQLPATAR